MNRRNPLLVAACAVALLGGACASTSTGNRLQVAPLDARETQTRFYEGTDAATAMKAGLDMLQDGDFTITRTDSALGLIVGTKRTVQSPSAGQKMAKWASIGLTYGLSALLPWSSTEIRELEASINVTAVGDDVRVRASLQSRVADKSGRIKRSDPVSDPIVYRDLFELLERSLFVTQPKGE